ncbi:MAG: TonB-dependent receptor [Pseudomonadota bacterium]
MAQSSKHTEPKLNLETKRLTLSLAVSAALAGAAGTQAETLGQLEEVIVTASKREMNLQDTPIAITAFTNEQITLQRFKNFSDYVGQIPGLAVSERQPGANSVIMRGCAAQGLSFSDSATTSLYLDEQPITAAGQNPDPRLIDIARVEALSGPQGTLFGDAAQCGTLRVITNKPDATVMNGWVDATASKIDGGDDGYDLSAMANIPLIEDTLAMRLVGFYADDPGWIDNVFSISPGRTFDNASEVDENVNSSTWYGGRFGVRLQLNDQWTVDFSSIYQKYELDGFGDIDLNQQQYEDVGLYPRFGNDGQARFSDDSWEDEWYQLAVTVEANLDIGDFVFTGAYFDREAEYFADATSYLQTFQQLGDYFREYDPYITQYDFGGDPLSTNFDRRETTSWTFEARYATPEIGRWSGIIGAFYNQRDVDEIFIANVVNGFSNTDAFSYINDAGYYFYGAPLKESSNNWFSGTYESELEQWAIFGEVSVDITEQFTILAGARYFEIENDYNVINGALVGENGGPPDCVQTGGVDYCYAPGDPGDADESDWVPKVTLSYSWENQMIYATYSEGFRRGGANSARPQSVFGPPTGQFPPPAGTLNQYDSDTVENYEIGAKTEWFDNKLRFNITAYHMIWNDIQVQAEDPQPDLFTLGIVNFPEAEINGFESWVSWLPTPNLSVELSVGYNDGELSDDAVLFPDGDPPLVTPKGTPLPIVPDWKGNLNVSYSFDTTLFEATPYVLARYTYTGSSVNSLDGIESSSFSFPPRKQDSWDTFDIQFGLESSSWTATVFMDNVFNEEAELFYNNRWSQQRLSVNQPRTIGLNVRYLTGDW